jgi:NTP pyrophosphatase (non-canonical NTP hydrolase)
MAMFQKLLDVVHGFLKKYPESNQPFEITTRLAEETGEVASQVIHQQKGKAKLKKHGQPNRKHLALEIQHVMQAALTLVKHYNLWEELEESIDKTREKLRQEGFIKD